MAKKSEGRGLGRGLSALLGEDVKVNPAPVDNVTALQPKRGELGLKDMPLDLITPNPDQPRTRFDDERIAELAQSIKDRGVLQPILVRPVKTDPGIYEIVAGERRWRAAQKAQLHRVPVIIQELSDKATFEIALVENIQRSELNPMDEARAYAKLMDEFGHSADAIGGLVGKSRSHVSNLMRLLALPPDISHLIEDGSISMGHGRALLSAARPLELAKRIMADGLSVRETEALVNASPAAGSQTKRNQSRPADPETRRLAEDISEALGLAVAIAHKGKKGGSVTIKYSTLEQLDEVCRRLANRHGNADAF